MTEPIERDYYAEAEAMLQRQADVLPADTDPEMLRMFHHPAVRQYIEATTRYPEAFKDIPIMSFRTIIKDYEEQQQIEKNRPRLKTENPPKMWRADGEEALLFGRVLAFFSAIFL